MISMRRFRAARHLGRMAVVAHRLQGVPTICPYTPGSKSERYWQQGVRDGQDFFDLAPPEPQAPSAQAGQHDA